MARMVNDAKYDIPAPISRPVEERKARVFCLTEEMARSSSSLLTVGVFLTTSGFDSGGVIVFDGPVGGAISFSCVPEQDLRRMLPSSGVDMRK